MYRQMVPVCMYPTYVLCGKVVGVIETSTCCVAIDNTVIVELAPESEA